MLKKLKAVFQYLFFLGLGIFLIWWSLKGLTTTDIQQISTALSKGNFTLIIPSLLIMLVGHWLRALRWRLIMEPLGYAPSKLNTFFAVMVGYLANQAVPRLGEVLKCSTLTKYEKIPLDKLLGTVILERTVDTICLLIVFVLALATQPNLYQNILQTFFEKQDSGNSHTFFTLLIVASVLAILAIVLFIVFSKKKTTGLVAKVKNISVHIWQGFIAIKSLKRPWLFIFQSLAIWFIYALSVYVGFMMLQETQQYGMAEALTVLSAGTLAMAATPGGIGAYAFLVQKTMFIYHLNGGVGLALGWILWLMQVFVVLTIGGLSLLGLPIYNRKKNIDAIN